MRFQTKKIILFFGDVFFLYLSLFLTLFLRFSNNFSFETFKKHLIPFSFLYFFWLLIFYVFGFFEISPLKSFLFKIFGGIFASLLFGALFFYFLPFFKITPKTILVLNALIFGIFVILWRTIFYYLFSIRFLKKVAVLGEGENVEILKKEIEEKEYLGFQLVSLNENPDLIIFTKEKESQILPLVDEFLKKGVDFLDFESAFEIFFEKIPVTEISKIWFLKNLKEGEKKIYDKIKRIFDIIFSLLILIFTLPLWPLIALAIKIEDKGPVFYLQERVGKDGKIFKLIKFRSMVVGAEKEGIRWAEAEDKRVTKVGKFLRRFHFDEIPQMINILKGEISLVGPRPERPEFVKELEKKIPYYNLRHIIKPGFTGWAQIKFRYARSVEDSLEKFQYDLYYIKNRSLFLDLKILLKTLRLFFKKE